MRITSIAFLALLLTGTLITISIVAVAQDQNNIGTHFSLEKSYGYYISPGSVIHYLNCITVVCGHDGNIILSINDSKVPKLPTPAGYSLPVTHIIQVPSGSCIRTDGNVTKVYKDGRCILTVIHDEIVPAYSGWIEQANDWTVPNLDRFWAYWDVPKFPPAPNSNTVDFLFNAIEPDDGSMIIQPVLEWNWGGSGRWTAAAWYVIQDTAY